MVKFVQFLRDKGILTWTGVGWQYKWTVPFYFPLYPRRLDIWINNYGWGMRFNPYDLSVRCRWILRVKKILGR